MRKPWIFALCLIVVAAAGLPLHAQSTTPAPAAVPAPDAGFLSALGAAPAPAPPAPLPWLPASCTFAQCLAGCTPCPRGCDAYCTSLTFCSCTCKSTHVPPLACPQ